MATDPGVKAQSNQEVNIGESKVDGTNNTANCTHTVIQVPRPPRRDDGKWMAIGSLVGTLTGMLTNSDIIKDAKKAEKDWTRLTDFFKEKGYDLNDWADKLRPCDDKLHEALCAFALCGYQTDYDGILRRARANAKLLSNKTYAEAVQTADRYHYGLNCDVWAGIKRAEVIATVVASTQAFEEERTKAFDRSFEVLERTTTLFERDVLNRKQLSADYLAGAGQNYGFLAQSLRATAKADMGDMQMLATAIAVVLPMLMNQCAVDACDNPKDTGGSTEQKPAG